MDAEMREILKEMNKKIEKNSIKSSDITPKNENSGGNSINSEEMRSLIREEMTSPECVGAHCKEMRRQEEKAGFFGSDLDMEDEEEDDDDD